MKTSRKLGLLATLYLAQGLPFGFFTQALPVLLRHQKVSLEAIGLTSLLALPWALKCFWAPLVDRRVSDRFGRRRCWIVPLQALSVITLLGIASFDPRISLPIILAGVLLTNLLAATQDIATDGLAVDLLGEQERGPGNGVQVAGYRVGMIIGGGLLLVVYQRLGWRWTFLCMAGVMALASIPVLRFREPPSAPAAQTGSLATLTQYFRRPGSASWLLLLVLYKFGDSLSQGMLRPYLVDRGMRLDEIGWILGGAGFGAGLVGALVGGWGVRLLGVRRSLVGFGLIQCLALAGYWWLAASKGGVAMVTAVCAFEHFTGGVATAALFTAMMNRSDPRTGATDYTIQASVVVLATGGAAALSGFVAARIGYAPHFALAAALQLLGIGAIFAVGARQFCFTAASAAPTPQR